MDESVAGLCLLLSLWVLGCTPEVEPLTPAQRQAVAAYVSKTPPVPRHRLDLDFDGKVKLLGYDLERELWAPGETHRIVWYWEVVHSLGAGWRLFTHIEHGGGEVLNRDARGPLRWLYGADRWRPGEFIEDPQDLHLPDTWPAGQAKIYVGFWRGEDRLPVTGSVPVEDGRALAVTVPTSKASRAARDVPRLSVIQTKRPPRLDGALDDPVWRFAKRTRAFVETRHGGRASVEASAKLLWDARFLYLGVEVNDRLLRASHLGRDDRLWEQDCVELMIAPGGNGEAYFEIQVSPRGTVFDTRYDSRRMPEPHGHTSWDSRARVGVSPRGEIDDARADAGYTVELAIPWQTFSSPNERAAVPAIGDEWRGNVYVMDLQAERQVAAAWSEPRVGDFHVPRRFGYLLFEGPPEDMLGTSEPLQLPKNRAPRPLQRPATMDPRDKDKLIETRAKKRRRPGEPVFRADPETVQTLEPSDARQ